jgi:hypothetical protein
MARAGYKTRRHVAARRIANRSFHEIIGGQSGYSAQILLYSSS